MSPNPNFFTRKILISNGVLLLLVLFIVIGSGVIAYLALSPRTGHDFSDYEGFDRVLEEIPLQTAREMVTYYRETGSSVGQTGRPIYNPKSIYFEIGALLKYLTEAKRIDRQATGVRVYFGRYRKPKPNATDGSRYTDHSSVIFVLTKKNADGLIEDILTEKNDVGILYQPYNAGVSCPPLLPESCNGEKL